MAQLENLLPNCVKWIGVYAHDADVCKQNQRTRVRGVHTVLEDKLLGLQRRGWWMNERIRHRTPSAFVQEMNIQIRWWLVKEAVFESVRRLSTITIAETHTYTKLIKSPFIVRSALWSNYTLVAK